jgi:hypothetical protein
MGEGVNTSVTIDTKIDASVVSTTCMDMVVYTPVTSMDRRISVGSTIGMGRSVYIASTNVYRHIYSQY